MVAKPVTGHSVFSRALLAPGDVGIHRSEIVQLDGESYRLREAKEQAAKRSKARSRRGAKSRASPGPRS